MRRRSGGAPAGRSPAPIRLRHLRREPLELAAPDVLEVLARRIGGRLLVEIDRDAEPFGDGRGDVLRQRDALLHRDALDRHERHDVDRAEPRMLALVLPEIDGGQRLLEERHRRRLERPAHQRA